MFDLHWKHCKWSNFRSVALKRRMETKAILEKSGIVQVGQVCGQSLRQTWSDFPSCNPHVSFRFGQLQLFIYLCPSQYPLWWRHQPRRDTTVPFRNNMKSVAPQQRRKLFRKIHNCFSFNFLNFSKLLKIRQLQVQNDRNVQTWLKEEIFRTRHNFNTYEETFTTKREQGLTANSILPALF